MTSMYLNTSKSYLPGRNIETPNRNYNEESLDHWCETCDKGFRTAFLLQNHTQTHQKCNIDGCQFTAHPNVITKHIQMQHATGLYKKITKSNDPEEIKKWREERKKKYPTKNNIEKKAALIKEKISRGEKMGINHKDKRKPFNSDFSSMKRQNGMSKNFEDRNQRKRRINEKTYNKEVSPNKRKEKKTFNILPPTEDMRTLKPFGGIQNLLFESDETEVEVSKDDLIEDDEYVNNTEIITQQENSELLVCGALSSLMCNYGSSDEDENSEMIENKKKENGVSIKTTQDKVKSILTSPHQGNNKSLGTETKEKEKKVDPIVSINENDDDDSGPEESKIVKEDTELPSNNGDKGDNTSTMRNNKRNVQVQHFKNKLKLRNNIFRRKLPSTLLEKLLHSEIQKERNIVLQCIRYIVKNNYFDVNYKKNI